MLHFCANMHTKIPQNIRFDVQTRKEMQRRWREKLKMPHLASHTIVFILVCVVSQAFLEDGRADRKEYKMYHSIPGNKNVSRKLLRELKRDESAGMQNRF